jgi:hypothetical protein
MIASSRVEPQNKTELTSAIVAVSAEAVQSDSVAVRVALLDVVDLRHSLRALLSRQLLMERRTMFARSGTSEFDLLPKWSALRASAHEPSYRSVTPLDTRSLPKFNRAADRNCLRLDTFEKRAGS